MLPPAQRLATTDVRRPALARLSRRPAIFQASSPFERLPKKSRPNLAGLLDNSDHREKPFTELGMQHDYIGKLASITLKNRTNP
jgi:hypothetical protein